MVQFTNHNVFVAQGHGLVRVGDSARAAKESLAEAIIEHKASTRNRKLLTKEPVLPIVGYLPIATVGWVQIGTDDDVAAYR